MLSTFTYSDTALDPRGQRLKLIRLGPTLPPKRGWADCPVSILCIAVWALRKLPVGKLLGWGKRGRAEALPELQIY